VRSAKDAINAMYAADSDRKLSSYLASTAKEIINTNAASSPSDKPLTDAKSASSLHHNSDQRKLESTRPSASAIFRMAKSKSERTPPPRPVTNSVDPLLEAEAPVVVHPPKPKAAPNVIPVVHTSLKLAPKKPPVVVRTQPAAPSRTNLRPAKGKISLSTPKPTDDTARTVASIRKATAAALKASAKSVTRSAPKPAAQAASKPTARGDARAVTGPDTSARSANSGRLMDIAPPSRRAHPSRVAPTAPIESSYTTKASKSVAKPTRSVKERFRPAPRGFGARRPHDARAEVFADFSNPDHPVKAQHLSLPAPSAVDIYSDIDTTIPATKAQSKENAEAGLGVVQDYHPQGDHAESRSHAEAPASEAHAAHEPSAPDNNQYTLGAQSPFFLKTVQVDKRPLSDGPKGHAEPTNIVYNTPRPNDAKGKAPYNKKSVKKSKSKAKAKPAKVDKKALRPDVPIRPTVIVPPSRRSHAPLFLLLLATILLGAAVGALSYLCFFQ